MFSLLIAGAAIWVAVYAIKLNLHQAKQLQQIYQALSSIQVYYYEDEWEDEFDNPPPRPSTAHHKVIDIFTGLPVCDDEE